MDHLDGSLAGRPDRDTSLPGPDLVDELLLEHDRIRRALVAVAEGDGDERGRDLSDLTSLLESHDRAEQVVLRPLTEAAGGHGVAASHTAQEIRFARRLAQLALLDLDGEQFEQGFDEFRTAVEEHLEHEEMLEFPLCRAVFTEGQLRELARAFRRQSSPHGQA